jgi:hypothetical protein
MKGDDLRRMGRNGQRKAGRERYGNPSQNPIIRRPAPHDVFLRLLKWAVSIDRHERPQRMKACSQVNRR